MPNFLRSFSRAWIALNEAQKKRAEKYANSWSGKLEKKSWGWKRYTKKRDASLQKGVELRKQQEVDRTQGEPVWFSRCILNGRLSHWVLITYGMKYELRRTDRTNSENAEQYAVNIQPYTIDQEKRDSAVTKLLIPEVDGYYVCLIGWTRMTAAEVSSAAQTVRSSFGSYHLLFNNCQDFLRELANQILVGPKAADFDWFMSNTKTEYQRDQSRLPPPEEAMLRSKDAIHNQRVMIATGQYMPSMFR